jgi:hypothetical protein
MYAGYYLAAFPLTSLRSSKRQPSNQSFDPKADKKAVFSSGWIFLQEEGAPLPAEILAGQCRGRAPTSYDFVYPTSENLLAAPGPALR